MSKYVTAEEAVKVIKSGDRVYIHTAAMAPQVLIDAMVARADELENVNIVHLHTEATAPYLKPELEHAFKLDSFFVGANARKATQQGMADYVPIFLSEVPKLFRQGYLDLDVAMVQVSPPDKHGYVSLGASVDASLAAVQCAKKVIAQVNPRVPRTLGDSCVHHSKFDLFVEHESPLFETHVSKGPGDVADKIGTYIAELVEDGATLQMGIGAIPNAVLAKLTNHKRLGIHTEMFTDGVIPLVDKGVITNEVKKIIPDHIVSSFVIGSKVTYDFVDDNPRVSMMDCAFVNDVAVIRQNPKVTAINSAIEVDITGQVCSDSIGTLHYSGVGGQMDFIRGASYSEGGKPIIALPSTTRHGGSKIVSILQPGAGVVTTRAHVHYIVTEYGVASLFGKPLKERARALIDIAHPDHREHLEREAKERWKGHFD